MEREYREEFPDLPEARERITNALTVPPIDDPVQRLHASVHATDCTLVGEDGSRWESLFNSFRPDDNPNWK